MDLHSTEQMMRKKLQKKLMQILQRKLKQQKKQNNQKLHTKGATDMSAPFCAYRGIRQNDGIYTGN